MGQQYLSPQQGRVPILSLWDRQPGGQTSFRTSIFILDLTKTPLHSYPQFLENKSFPRIPTTPGTLPGGVTLQHQWGAIGILSLGLASGSAAGRPLSTHTNAFNPWDLENNSFPGIPNSRGVNGATIPTTTTRSCPNLKPLG